MSRLNQRFLSFNKNKYHDFLLILIFLLISAFVGRRELKQSNVLFRWQGYVNKVFDELFVPSLHQYNKNIFFASVSLYTVYT